MPEIVTVIDADAFAKAGEALRSFNGGEGLDAATFGQVAAVFEKVRKHEGYASLQASDQARLRGAAEAYKSRIVKEESRMLNFFDQVFGAMRKPEKLEAHTRDVIATFLISVAKTQ